MDATPERLLLLHGDLDLHIREARDLPNMDMFTERIRRCLGACGLSLPTRRRTDREEEFRTGKKTSPHFPLQPKPKAITSDPYVKVILARDTLARTRVIPNSLEPHWNEHFKLFLAHRAGHIEFEVKDSDVFGAQLIGTATVPADRIASGQLIDDWFPVIAPSGRPPRPASALRVSMSFTPVEKNPAYRNGIPGDPEKRGVRDTYFPLRKGGMLTLYQDAHVRQGDLPYDIELEGGAVFRHNKCWEDICEAILEAHHLIYIAGWSIYHKVKLVRERSLRIPAMAEALTLGELLKYKSEEGVRVCLLVWDDRTSHDKLFFKTGGVMQTHDEETRKFFKHSSVICVLSPRYASHKLSMVKQQVVGTLFTHHQKCLLVDTEASRTTRKITAFVGGLDLCDGRYDTPEHRLFRDLDTVFLNDFHNPTIPGQTKGPRQPWHDLHCKIDGPAAYDVLENFEQRWKKASRFWVLGQKFKGVTHWHDDALIKIDRISWILSPSCSDPYGDPNLWVSEEKDSENWHIQIFRSIDSGSVKGFPRSVHEAEAQNLVCGKNLVIDKSIHTAYVKAIRSAQHFIYIENQYFIGSSYGWPSYQNAEADNLIPMELALKIVNKISVGERFAVYIVIPLWPEGDPKSQAVQEILFWQSQTIKMMYGIIGGKLKSMGIQNVHPQDYLNFYCLGNRELLPEGAIQSTNQPLEKTAVVLSQKYQRFMIYVHAKGMIVDDEYVILGSANINQRSLDGSRDTEIAMGAYQPHYAWSETTGYPHGQQEDDCMNRRLIQMYPWDWVITSKSLPNAGPHMFLLIGGLHLLMFLKWIVTRKFLSVWTIAGIGTLITFILSFLIR
ncbi:phospholipase D delta-like isoform X2 [Phoenix dactylifera]|uniref:Phospholipase D n=1 Tax=Phoenix dactylifera TaxID=42345 RepID=A0A8B8J2A4_PHODC|nr:phospholipase D delta-like isoform X2 [Phoenix dactylifera]